MLCHTKGRKKWWSRLLKQERKPPVFLKVDWDKWVDEDEEHGRQPDTEMDFGDIDLSNLNMEGTNYFDVNGVDKFEEDENALYAQVVTEVKAEKNINGELSEINCNCECSKCINCVKRVGRTSYMQEIPEALEQGITISEVNLRNFRPDFYFMKETFSMEHNKNWTLSTAIARHVCCNKEWFADYKESEGSVMVNAFGISMPILGTGTIHLLTEQGIVVTLHNVRHVPGGDNNAISVGSLTSFSYHVTMAAGCMEAFRPDNTSILYAPRGEVLWYVSCTTLVPMEMDPNTKEIYRRFKNDKVTTRSETILSGGGKHTGISETVLSGGGQQPGGRQQSGGGQQRNKKGGRRQQHN